MYIGKPTQLANAHVLSISGHIYSYRITTFLHPTIPPMQVAQTHLYRLTDKQRLNRQFVWFLFFLRDFSNGLRQNWLIKVIILVIAQV